MKFSKDLQLQVFNVCLDIGCIITLIDQDFLKKVAPNAVVKKIVSLISIRDVKSGKHVSADYAMIDLFFPGAKRHTVAITREIHMVDSLKTKMLISINILSRKSFMINTENTKAKIRSCNGIVILLEVIPCAHMQFIQQILLNKAQQFLQNC